MTDLRIVLGPTVEAVLEVDRPEVLAGHGLYHPGVPSTRHGCVYAASAHAWRDLAEDLEARGARGSSEGWDLDAGARRACRNAAAKIRRVLADTAAARMKEGKGT